MRILFICSYGKCNVGGWGFEVGDLRLGIEGWLTGLIKRNF